MAEKAYVVKPVGGAFIEAEGTEYHLEEGSIYSADHPAVRSHPDLFVEAEDATIRPSVEAATAAPGEKRGAPEKAPVEAATAAPGRRRTAAKRTTAKRAAKK